MNLFVGGLPNSGTTFVAHVLKQAGFDFSDDVWPHDLKRKGMEWLPARRWQLTMFQRLGVSEPSERVLSFTDPEREEYWRQYPPPADPPPCLKLPDFNIHRLDRYYKPESIVKVVRPFDSWQRSMRTQRPVQDVDLLHEVYTHTLDALPGRTVGFPDCVYDPTLISAVVDHDITEAHRLVVKPEWVSFR